VPAANFGAARALPFGHRDLNANFIANIEVYISIEWHIDLSFIVSLRSQRDIVFKERLDARAHEKTSEQMFEIMKPGTKIVSIAGLPEPRTIPWPPTKKCYRSHVGLALRKALARVG
jgi:hypothetical protein